MFMIIFVRSDDRLIHGQVQTKIVPLNQINRIVCVDDTTASNPTLKKIFEAASPVGTKTTVHTLERAIPLIQKAVDDSKYRILILARRPSTLAKIYKAVPGMLPRLDIANIPQSKDSANEIMVAKDCYCDQRQMAAIKEMAALGVEIYFELFPGQSWPTVYWKDIKGKY